VKLFPAPRCSTSCRRWRGEGDHGPRPDHRRDPVHTGDAVVLCTGGYVNAFYLSTNAMGCSVTALWKAHKKGAFFANLLHTDPPDCIPQAGGLPVEADAHVRSLRNDGRIWVPKKKKIAASRPTRIPRRTGLLPRAEVPSFGNLAPRDISSRAAKEQCDEDAASPGGRGVYLDFRDSIKRFGENVIRERYGNLFEMYERITDENGYKSLCASTPPPLRHGGLWVDYNLMSNLPGLFVLAKRTSPSTGRTGWARAPSCKGLRTAIRDPLHDRQLPGADETGKVKVDHAECRKSIEEVKGTTKKLLSTQGNRTVTEFMRELGTLMWNNCGWRAARNPSPRRSRRSRHPRRVLAEREGERHRAEFNQQLENAGAQRTSWSSPSCSAGRAPRNESCGGHFRVEYQYEDGEAKRDDANYAYAAAWEFKGVDKEPELHKEPLKFENIHLAVRSYK